MTATRISGQNFFSPQPSRLSSKNKKKRRNIEPVYTAPKLPDAFDKELKTTKALCQRKIVSFAVKLKNYIKIATYTMASFACNFPGLHSYLPIITDLKRDCWLEIYGEQHADAYQNHKTRAATAFKRGNVLTGLKQSAIAFKDGVRATYYKMRTPSDD